MKEGGKVRGRKKEQERKRQMQDGERERGKEGGEERRRKGVGSREKTWCKLQKIFIIRE